MRSLLTYPGLIGTLLLVVQTLLGATPGSVNPPKAPPAHSGSGPRVLVIYDMEGLAGEDDWRMACALFPEKYALGQRLLAEDVNAVVAGLFAGGAAVVDVWDSHGNYESQYNLPPERLDSRVRLYFHLDDDAEVDKNTYDAVALVGMHAKAGSGGFMAHAGTFGLMFIYNGRSASETEAYGYDWGEKGVPVIFVCGDDRLREDVMPVMPWLKYVVTKHALSPARVELRPVETVRREMREGAAAAVRGIAQARPLRVSTPIHAALRAVPPADLSALRNVPGVIFVDGEVRFEAPNLQAAHRGLGALAWIAVVMGKEPVMRGIMEKLPSWKETERQRDIGFWEYWIEMETDRAKTAAGAL